MARSSYANGLTSLTSSSAYASSSNSNSSGAGNYHTLGTYRVQYAPTNPFLDFDNSSAGMGSNTNSSGGNAGRINGNNSSGNGSSSSGSERSASHRSALNAFHSSDSKNGSDEYDDLK